MSAELKLQGVLSDPNNTPYKLILNTQDPQRGALAKINKVLIPVIWNNTNSIGTEELLELFSKKIEAKFTAELKVSASSHIPAELVISRKIQQSVVVNVALTTLPFQIRSIDPDLIIDIDPQERKIFHEKCKFEKVRTYRTLIAKFHNLDHLENEGLRNCLEKMQKNGFVVPIEKLVTLKESTESKWSAFSKSNPSSELTLCVIPQQNELSKFAPRLCKEGRFESAFSDSVNPLSYLETHILKLTQKPNLLQHYIRILKKDSPENHSLLARIKPPELMCSFHPPLEKYAHIELSASSDLFAPLAKEIDELKKHSSEPLQKICELYQKFIDDICKARGKKRVKLLKGRAYLNIKGYTTVQECHFVKQATARLLVSINKYGEVEENGRYGESAVCQMGKVQFKNTPINASSPGLEYAIDAPNSILSEEEPNPTQLIKIDNVWINTDEGGKRESYVVQASSIKSKYGEVVGLDWTRF